MLVSTLARTTAPNALVNYRILYVPQRLPVNSLLPQWIALMTCPVRLPSVLLARSTSSEYVTSVHETSKVPIAPMRCLAFVTCFVPSHSPLPAQGPNLYFLGARGSTVVCSNGTTLTGVDRGGIYKVDPACSPPSDPTGVIIGVIIGVILALALVILHRRRRNMRRNKARRPLPAAQEPPRIEPMASRGGLVTKALALARAAAARARAAAVVEAVTVTAESVMEQQEAVPAPSIAPAKLSSASGTSYSHSSTTSSSNMVGSLTLSESASASAKARMTRAQELLKAFELDASEITTFEKLGEGGQAVVVRGWWRGIDVAIKQPRPRKGSRGKPISPDAFDPTSPHDSFNQALRREVRALSRVRHPNVIKLHGACFEPAPMILMSYAPSGTLQDALDKH